MRLIFVVHLPHKNILTTNISQSMVVVQVCVWKFGIAVSGPGETRLIVQEAVAAQYT